MESIESYQQLSVFVEALLLKFFDQHDTMEFSNDHEKLHRSFFELKKKYPDYFKRLLFDTNGFYPVSDDLDSIFQDFQICGITNKYNPIYKTYRFNNDVKFNNNRKKRIPFVKDDEINTIASELSL